MFIAEASEGTSPVAWGGIALGALSLIGTLIGYFSTRSGHRVQATADKLKAETATETRKAARLAREHATLDKVIDTNLVRIQALESRLERNEQRLDDAEKKLADARVDIAKLEGELKNKDATIAHLQQLLGESEAEHKLLVVKLAEVEGEREELRSRLRTAEAQMRLLCQAREDASEDDNSAADASQ